MIDPRPKEESRAGKSSEDVQLITKKHGGNEGGEATSSNEIEFEDRQQSSRENEKGNS